MTTYADLGVRPVINANATLTSLGGSLMPPPVVAAMAEAARSFVDLHELQAAASARLATLTRNEAALVTCGASAGLLLSTLGAMTGDDHRALATLLEHGARALPRHEVVIHRAHRIPYDTVLTLAGAQVVEVGNALQTFRWELEAAIGPRTAAVLYVAGSHLERGALPLEEVVAAAHAQGVPVIVDAAAQLPPAANLWGFTARGADLVTFSGGKELRGPQASGLLLGTRAAVAASALHAAPHQRFGRPAKVGKEELVGLVTALELWLARDHDADLARIEAATAAWVARLDALPGVTARRDFPGEAGRPLPRPRLDWDPAVGFSGADLATALRAGTPAIDIAVAGPHAVWVSPELVEAYDEDLVLDRVAAAVTALGAGGAR